MPDIDTSRLAPHQAAAVRTTDLDANGRPVEITIGRGAAVPDNLADGELERLKRAGAFDPAPSARTVTVPEAQVALVNYLPPQVTLAANDEEGNPAAVVALAPVHPAKSSAAGVEGPPKSRR